MRFNLKTLLLAVFASALICGAARRFLGVALDLQGQLAAGLHLVLGTVVGNIVGTQKASGWCLLGVTLVFYFGLVNGWIPDFGDDLMMWAFLCLSSGLMLGLTNRLTGLDWQPGNAAATDHKPR